MALARTKQRRRSCGSIETGWDNDSMDSLTFDQIAEEEKTPLVEALCEHIQKLRQAIIKLTEEKAQLEGKKQEWKDKQQKLKDEIAVLKGEKKRPTFQASKLDKKAGENENAPGSAMGKRPGSDKRSKTAQLEIHEVIPIEPEGLPEGSRFLGYRDFVVQGLIIKSHNISYRLKHYVTPDGKSLVGKLPASVKGHFSPDIVTYAMHQYYACHVTQPLLLDQLREFGVDISSGQINALLQGDKEDFHMEKDALLPAALSVSTYVTVDDTGARHKGKNGYVTHIGNESFAWFKSSSSKSRINFLQLLRNAHTDYWIDEDALAYMKQHGLAKSVVSLLSVPSTQRFPDEKAWQAHLDCLKITKKKHRRIATEGALVGSILQHGFSKDLAIISDDAGQFLIFLHGLCWVHAERHIHKLIPLNDAQREEQKRVRSQIWELYGDLKKYKKQPTAEQQIEIEARFEAIFTQHTTFPELTQKLARLYRNKSGLLLVLKRPDVPLHTNGSEGDIREKVKDRKLRGGTRSDNGQQCRDTFASLKKTCRKLGISFWSYLKDRISGENKISPLSELIRQYATAPPH
jgi:Transposase IS66 family